MRSLYQPLFASNFTDGGRSGGVSEFIKNNPWIYFVLLGAAIVFAIVRKYRR